MKWITSDAYPNNICSAGRLRFNTIARDSDLFEALIDINPLVILVSKITFFKVEMALYPIGEWSATARAIGGGSLGNDRYCNPEAVNVQELTEKSRDGRGKVSE